MTQKHLASPGAEAAQVNLYEQGRLHRIAANNKKLLSLGIPTVRQLFPATTTSKKSKPPRVPSQPTRASSRPRAKPDYSEASPDKPIQQRLVLKVKSRMASTASKQPDQAQPCEADFAARAAKFFRMTDLSHPVVLYCVKQRYADF